MNNSHSSSKPIKSIVIAGGGAAGWLTAGVLAARYHNKEASAVSITLVESPDVKILGVGEGTWPTMRDTLRKIGIDEETFIQRCDASFKQGTCFHQWRTGQPGDTYYHPFELPAGFLDADIGAWWLDHTPDAAFGDLFSAQPALCEHALAPKQPQTPPYAAVANYGYHLDANKFADLLKAHCISNLGVRHVVTHITALDTDSDNHITALLSDSARIEGELFIDCTGFAARLIGEHYGIPLTEVGDVLKNNTALAVQAPYVDEQVPIASATLSTAQECGWVWDIGLPHRKGVGYVYSDEFCTPEQAADELKAYLAKDPKIQSVSEDKFRTIRFTPGYRETTWVKNCVAVGTSAGFFEPLEASALVMIELAAKHIASQLPADMSALPAVARHYNRAFSAKWQRIIDFLKLHYVLSERRDSEYWRAMTSPDSMSEQLHDWLVQWRQRPASIEDFMYSDELFPLASYMYILYGMGLAPERGNRAAASSPSVEHYLRQNQQRKQQYLAGLPTNRALIHAIRQRAMMSQ
ncbi:tryptophan halogenase family protein [Alteromonas sp. CYL-A6]|uniref:tryptophan halogenase family protein n=1 Tax=Alteromonas nitratireducens TaxID=3390813 RepID=UPI0034BD8F24